MDIIYSKKDFRMSEKYLNCSEIRESSAYASALWTNNVDREELNNYLHRSRVEIIKISLDKIRAVCYNTDETTIIMR